MELRSFGVKGVAGFTAFVSLRPLALLETYNSVNVRTRTRTCYLSSEGSFYFTLGFQAAVICCSCSKRASLHTFRLVSLHLRYLRFLLPKAQVGSDIRAPRG